MNAIEARRLAHEFRSAAAALRDRRQTDAPNLTPSQSLALAKQEGDLLNLASAMITRAVGLSIDDAQASAANLHSVVLRARKVIAALESARQVISVGAALVALGGAVVSTNPAAIALSLDALAESL